MVKLRELSENNEIQGSTAGDEQDGNVRPISSNLSFGQMRSIRSIIKNKFKKKSRIMDGTRGSPVGHKANLDKVWKFITAHNKLVHLKQSTESSLDESATERKGTTTIMDMPLEIILIVMRHLEPLDCTVLRYTCRQFCNSLPFDSESFKRLCARHRLLVRLFETNILPEVKHGDRSLTKSEIREHITSERRCIFCQRFWPLMGKQVHCPFHPPVGKPRLQPPLKIRKVSQLFDVKYVRRVIRGQRVWTTESYRQVVSESSYSTNFQSQYYSTSFGRTWFQVVTHYEKEFNEQLKRKHMQENNNSLETYRDENTLWLEDKKWRKKHDKGVIWPLFCCNHCMNVLPHNSYVYLCGHCDCTSCGWTEVEILRTFDKKLGFPIYVLLGKIADLAEDSDDNDTDTQLSQGNVEQINGMAMVEVD